MSYSDYYSEKLKDPRWQKLRLKVFERDNWTCCVCKATGRTLAVHHKFYTTSNPWDEPTENLQTLCDICHGATHVAIQLHRMIIQHAGESQFTSDAWCRGLLFVSRHMVDCEAILGQSSLVDSPEHVKACADEAFRKEGDPKGATP